MIARPMILAASLAAAAALSGVVKAGPVQRLEGTYRLVSHTRTIVATGQVESGFGAKPMGYIMYGRDGRMLVLMVRDDRPRPTLTGITDAQRIELFNSMAAYGGTYTFDGKTVTHDIDISGNEALTGTKVIRQVRIDGRRLIYTTKPGPAPTDGKIVTSELIWEKVEPTRAGAK